MKDVLALLSPTVSDQLSAAARYALGVARAYNARLSVLIAEIECIDPSPEPDIMQAGSANVEPPSSSERLERTAKSVLSAAKAASVSCDMVSTIGDVRSLRERVIHSSQLRDVLIVDSHGPLQPPRKDLIDGALFGSGRPLILVPQGVGEFASERIVIAWDATRAAVRAVHDALPLLVRARDVTVVSVVDDKTTLTQGTGEALCRHLVQWNIASKFVAINREELAVGTALLTFARKVDANLLAMGSFAHGFEREIMLGSATRDVYRSYLEMPVLLSH